MSESFLEIGVLGGMGPEATVHFMSRVIALTPGDSDQDHLRMLVDQNPAVPDRQDALLRDGESPGPVLAEMAERLAADGCDFLVMPCNTAHAYEGDIISAVSIPFISIIDATLDAAIDANNVGVMATTGLIRANVYQSALKARGRECLLPGDEDIDELTRLAFEIKSGNKSVEVKAGVTRIANALIARGADVIVLGCTEFPLVLAQGDINVPLLSSTDELAKLTVALARGDKQLPEIHKRNS